MELIIMNWDEVYEWLKNNGHIKDTWDYTSIDEDSLYSEDDIENTFISIFTRAGNELVVYVGCLVPKISVGRSGAIVHHHEDVINYLENNLEQMYDELMKDGI